MKIRGEKIVQIPKVGKNATIQIPEFDRGPSDPKNLLVVILSAENNLYEVGCKQAKISTKFTAADLDLLSEKLIYPGDVPNDVSLTLRSVVGKRSGGQGYIKCNCKSDCITNRCGCTKNNKKCNSK